MFTITASQDRPQQLKEIEEILSPALLLEAREFPNGAVIARFVTEYGAYACTADHDDVRKLWLDDSYQAIADMYDTLTHSNLCTE